MKNLYHLTIICTDKWAYSDYEYVIKANSKEEAFTKAKEKINIKNLFKGAPIDIENIREITEEITEISSAVVE
jgi:hypothetical protein